MVGIPGRKQTIDETAATPPTREAPTGAPRLSVRTISTEQHLSFIRTLPSASFLQTPAWGQVKTEWRHESLGWFDANDKLVGAGLVLYRQLPKVRRYLAYLPEGPLIDWAADDIGEWLAPMAEHLKSSGAFGIRIGCPLVARRGTRPRSRSPSPTSGSVGSARHCPISPITMRPGSATGFASWAGGRRARTRGSPPVSRASCSSCRWPARPKPTCWPG